MLAGGTGPPLNRHFIYAHEPPHGRSNTRRLPTWLSLVRLQSEWRPRRRPRFQATLRRNTACCAGDQDGDGLAASWAKDEHGEARCRPEPRVANQQVS